MTTLDTLEVGKSRCKLQIGSDVTTLDTLEVSKSTKIFVNCTSWEKQQRCHHFDQDEKKLVINQKAKKAGQKSTKVSRVIF